MRANERDAQVLIWAHVLGICPNANGLYRDVKPGQRFRLKPDGEVLTKVQGGWYEDPQGRRFKTGQRVAVERIA